ncbi:beta-galactosidase trimerization domain-containing protein [Cohnella sp.]|uniref:beta-galactosidase trimerization domain-containing protein n=1 Tax=Cohnella sp. TaxID=1883426 RepID=UPI00356ADF2E
MANGAIFSRLRERSRSWYNDDFFAGETAVTVHKLGQGQVLYLGTVAEENFYLDLFREIANRIGLIRFDGLPEGV